MENDKLKDLFQSYQPALSPDSLFLDKLKKNMEAIELIRQHTGIQRKRNRTALCVASLTGFAMGVILTLLFPLIRDTVSSFNISISGYGIFDIHVNWQIIGWIVMAGVCALTSLNAYEITISRLTARKAYA